MNLLRCLRHLSAPLWRLQRAFDADTLIRIGQAVADSERTHTGEIRFAVESRLPLSYLLKNLPARARAQMVFSKLRVWDTEANNGVLIYVLLAERSVDIVADRGIARHVTQAQWNAVCDAMRACFRADDFGAGALAGVQGVGALLAAHFPAATDRANPDELTNTPKVL